MNTTTTIQAKPTKEQFDNYQLIYEYFNKALFNNGLANCILNFSRLKNSHGFFAPSRWENGEFKTHEISLNPDTLAREPKAVLSTLVHEMCHLWQQDHGKAPRRCYHDKQWAQKMEEVGLIPSANGLPGGKKTGQNMTHYIEEGGAFEIAFDNMPKDLLLPFKAIAFPTMAKKSKQKTVYICPGCESKVWGKSGLSISCDDCEEKYLEQVTEDEDGEQ
jgi:predicted SprT family Zn-dependent metalloprotease